MQKKKKSAFSKTVGQQIIFYHYYYKNMKERESIIVRFKPIIMGHQYSHLLNHIKILQFPIVLL